MDKELEDKIAHHLERFDIVIVFGSQVSESARPGSDIDIALAGKQTLSTDEKVSLINSLSKLTGKEIDLIDLNAVSGAILKEVLTKGRFIVARDLNLKAWLIRKMLYNQADMMPYTERILRERRKRFLNG